MTKATIRICSSCNETENHLISSYLSNVHGRVIFFITSTYIASNLRIQVKNVTGYAPTMNKLLKINLDVKC